MAMKMIWTVTLCRSVSTHQRLEEACSLIFRAEEPLVSTCESTRPNNSESINCDLIYTEQFKA